MRLSEYANQNNIPYHKAWRQFRRGEIKGNVTDGGNIEIDGVIPATTNSTSQLQRSENLYVSPKMEMLGSTETRRNRAATIERTDKYANIESGLLPYTQSNANRSGKASIYIHDAILLCQYAYYNISVFKSTIDLLTEFSASNIFLRGGSKKSRDFFNSYFKKINMWGLQDRFFRELWRSGNVFLYRFDGELTKSDINSITQTFGAEDDSKSNKVTLPLRYIIINPSEVRMDGTATFTLGRYFKVLNGYEIQRLRSRKTEEDIKIYENLPEDVKRLVDAGGPAITEILMPLNPEYLSTVFNKKQDYESFSTPTFFPVLSDINIKEEYKKIDAAIARVMQQIVLLVNVGYESKEGNYNVNVKAIEEMQALFKNESVGRVLVTDFATKVSFIIPQIADILNKDKYEVIENDIKIGLGNVLMAGADQKFANQSISVQVFMERLKHARQAFLQDFLIIEMKRIAKSLNFKSCPEPFFEEMDLKDEIQMARIYTDLAKIGLLTADEAIRAIDSGQLPTPEENLESQKAFKESRSKGLYEPLIGGKKDEGGPEGRPTGSKSPQTTKNVKPIGTTKANEEPSIQFSSKKVIELTSKAIELKNFVNAELFKKYKIKKLNKDQELAASGITEVIITNELPENWKSSVAKYVSSPLDTNQERVNKTLELAAKFGVSSFHAAILLNSVI